MRTQEVQPGGTLFLVGTQLSRERIGEVDLLKLVPVSQFRHGLEPSVFLGFDNAQVHQFLPPVNAQPVNSDAVAGDGAQFTGFLHELTQLVEFLSIDGNHRHVFEDQVFVAHGQRRKQLSERHLQSVDGHLNRQVEPVPGAFPRFDAYRGRFRIQGVVRQVFVAANLDVRMFFQQREKVHHELDSLVLGELLCREHAIFGGLAQRLVASELVLNRGNDFPFNRFLAR